MPEKPTKIPKPKKPPKLFRGEISEDKLNKKVLKRIYIHEYKDFLNEALIKDEKNNYHVRDNLDKKEFKKLKKIAKTVKANTGFVQKGKLIVLGIIIGAVILFNMLFLNMLMDSVIESGLESIFNAQADLEGLQFAIFDGHIYFDSLKVANSQKPFNNLFDLGKTEVSIDMVEILKGKVIINNIECQEINWDTKRTTSGALAGSTQQTQQEQAEAAEEQGLFSLDFSQIDVEGLLEDQKEKITSLKLVDELQEQYKDMADKWSGTIDDYKTEIDNLSPTIDSIKSININNIKTIQQAQDSISKIDTAIKQVDALQKKVSNSYSTFEKDLKTIENDSARITKAITDDFNYLSSFINITDPETQSLVASLGDKYLRGNLKEIFGYAMQAVGYLDQIKPGQDKEKKAKQEQIAQPTMGRDVRLPGVKTPDFWLKNFSFSIGKLAATDFFEADLENITSEPDLINLPVTLFSRYKHVDQEIKLDVNIDMRSTQNQLFNLDADLANYPFNLEEGISFLNITNFNCIYTLGIDFAMDKQNASSGNIDISLTNIAVEFKDKSNEISKFMYDILTTTPQITIQSGFKIAEDGKIDMTLNSNLDKIIQDKIGKLIEELIVDVQKQLKAELDKFMAEELAEYNDLYKDLIDLDGIFEGNILNTNNFDKVIEDKKKEVEKQIKKIEDEIKGQVEDAVEDKAGDILDKLPF